MNFTAWCTCRSIWCKLDWISRCQVPWICDHHDIYIRGA